MSYFNADYALLLVRIILALVFISAGYKKLFETRDKTKKMLDGIGFKPAGFWAFILGFVELVGGLFVLLDVYVIWAASFLGLVMLVALFVKAFKWGSDLGSMELDFALLALNAVLVAMGGGSIGLGI